MDWFLYDRDLRHERINKILDVFFSKGLVLLILLAIIFQTLELHKTFLPTATEYCLLNFSLSL